MPEFLVYETVLKADQYEAGAKKVVQTTKEIEAAQNRATQAGKRLQDSVGPAPMAGLQRIAEQAKTSSTKVGGRTVATVGNMHWLVNEPDAPSATKKGTPGFFGGLRAQLEANANTPKDWGKLRSDVARNLGSIRPRIDFGRARKDASDFADHMKDGLEKSLSSLSPLKAVGTSFAAMAAAGAASGLALMSEAADFDSLRMSLNAVEGNAKKSREELKDLKGIARAPGIGLEESVAGYSGLRNAGLSEEFSEKLIKEIANANARGGGGAESFGRIMLQLRQAAGREYLSQEDLTPIGEAGIPVNSILKKLYGTGDTEELKAKGITADKAIHDLVDELAKMPRVAGGAKNDFDNIGDTLKFAAVAAGDGLNSGLLPYLRELGETVDTMTESGEIQAAFETAAINIAAIFSDSEEGMEGVMKDLLVAVQDLTAAARNLTLNGKGVVDVAQTAFKWLNPLGPVTEGVNQLMGGGRDDLMSEHERNAKSVESRSEVRKSREGWERAKKGGYKGTYIQWDGLSRQDQKAWLDKADAAKGTKGTDPTKPGLKEPVDPGKKKTDEAQERTAKATEQLVHLKKKEMDMDSVTMGGGELARMGITATELNPGPPAGADEIHRLIYRAMELAGGVAVARRQAARTRNQGRGLY